jgi:Skp family chaperone for outer membrane proteins
MRIRFALFLLATLWCGIAFASDHDKADIAFAQAQTSVQAAEAADAASAAPVEFNAAQGNLAAARGALDRRNWEASAMSSEKAQADAELAAARAREKRATAATAEIEASVETLRRELNRPGS